MPKGNQMTPSSSTSSTPLEGQLFGSGRGHLRHGACLSGMGVSRWGWECVWMATVWKMSRGNHHKDSHASLKSLTYLLMGIMAHCEDHMWCKKMRNWLPPAFPTPIPCSSIQKQLHCWWTISHLFKRSSMHMWAQLCHYPGHPFTPIPTFHHLIKFVNFLTSVPIEPDKQFCPNEELFNIYVTMLLSFGECLSKFIIKVRCIV